MSEKNEAPVLPGEVWRGAVTLISEKIFCATTVDGDAVKTWSLWGTSWREVGSLVEKRALAAWALSLRVSLAAALRTADRLRHGQEIEGGDVCPNEMRAEKAEHAMRRRRGAGRRRR